MATLKNTDYIEELEREQRMRLKVYPKQIKDNRLSKKTANKRYQLLDNTKKLFEELELKGITYDQLIAELQKLPTARTYQQGSLFQNQTATSA